MAAYHWEARRRQMQMERRLRLLQQEREVPGKGQRQEVLGAGNAKGLPPSYSTSPPKPALQDVAGCSCTCNTAHAPQHSGRLLQRYSSTEYIQQW